MRNLKDVLHGFGPYLTDVQELPDGRISLYGEMNGMRVILERIEHGDKTPDQIWMLQKQVWREQDEMRKRQ